MLRFTKNMNSPLFAGLLGGVLLAGLGSGMAFAKYIEFDYIPPQEETQSYTTEQFTYTMGPEERIAAPTADSISLDESVPEGTILVDIEYNPHTMEADFITYENNDTNETIVETISHYIADDFELFMVNKNTILQGLKEGKIVSVQTDCHFKTTVTANPADENRIAQYPGGIKVVG